MIFNSKLLNYQRVLCWRYCLLTTPEALLSAGSEPRSRKCQDWKSAMKGKGWRQFLMVKTRVPYNLICCNMIENQANEWCDWIQWLLMKWQLFAPYTVHYSGAMQEAGNGVSAIGSASWLPTLETGAVLVNAGDLVAVVKAWRTQQNWTPRNVKENMNRPIDPHVQPVKVVLMLDLCWKTCWVFNPYTKYHDWGYEARFEMGILAANQGFGGASMAMVNPIEGTPSSIIIIIIQYNYHWFLPQTTWVDHGKIHMLI